MTVSGHNLKRISAAAVPRGGGYVEFYLGSFPTLWDWGELRFMEGAAARIADRRGVVQCGEAEGTGDRGLVG